jgi:hypothetical protein
MGTDMVRPLCPAEDIGPDDRVLVECTCRHVEELSAAMLVTAGIKPYIPRFWT